MLGRWACSHVACSFCSAGPWRHACIASARKSGVLTSFQKHQCGRLLCNSALQGMHALRLPARPFRCPGHTCRYATQPSATPVAPSLREQDIPDPFYDDNSGLSEAERLRLVIRQMQSACKGLLQQLIDLQHRWLLLRPFLQSIELQERCSVVASESSTVGAAPLESRNISKLLSREQFAISTHVAPNYSHTMCTD